MYDFFYRKQEHTFVNAFYDEDPDLPCLFVSGALKPVDALDLLLNSVPTAENVCRKKPVFVKKAAVFLVDTSQLGSPDDLVSSPLSPQDHALHCCLPSRCKLANSGNSHCGYLQVPTPLSHA